MKKLLLLLLILIPVLAFSQWTRPNNSYGVISNRASFDSVVFFPSGCSIPPKLNRADSLIKKSAIYFDTCNHIAWWYDPHLAAWDTLNKAATGTAGAGANNYTTAVTFTGGNLTTVRNGLSNLVTDMNGYWIKYSDTSALVATKWFLGNNYYTQHQLNTAYAGGQVDWNNIINKPNTVGIGNIATAPQQATGSYTHDWRGYDLIFEKIRSLQIYAAALFLNADSIILNSGYGRVLIPNLTRSFTARTKCMVVDTLDGHVYYTDCSTGGGSGLTYPYTANYSLNGYGAWFHNTTDSIPEGSSNLYYTNARARSALSVTNTGTTGAASYNSSTGVFNIPIYSNNNIYNVDGSVTGSGTRMVNMNNHDLLFYNGTNATARLGYPQIYFSNNYDATHSAFMQVESQGTINSDNNASLGAISGSTSKAISFYPDQVLWTGFGSGLNTGTPAYYLTVNSSGKMVEVAAGSVGGGSAYVLNVGAAMRLGLPYTPNIKTLRNRFGVVIDSTTTNELGFTLDTTALKVIYPALQRFLDSCNAIRSAIGTGGSGANTALSNLASVSINASLIPQSGKDLGAAVTAWHEIYIYGGATYGSHSIKITGTPTGNRTFTLPNYDATAASLAGTETLTNKTLNSPVINTPTGIVKGDVGLGNVDNTSDATKNSAAASLTNKKLGSLTSNGLVKTTGGDGTLSIATVGTDYQAPISVSHLFTFTSNTIDAKKTLQTLTDGSSVTVNVDNGYNSIITTTHNPTFTFTNVANGEDYRLYATASGADRYLTFPGGLIDTLAASDSAVYVVNYANDAYRVYRLGKSYTASSSSRKVDTLYRTAGKDSIIFTISGIRYAIKDSVGGSSGGGVFTGVRATISSNQSITNNTPTVLAFAAEDFDTDAFHDNSTNNSRFTVPSGKDGYYQIGAFVEQDQTGLDLISVRIKLNGSTVISASTVMGNYATPSDHSQANLNTLYHLNVGDYVEIEVYQRASGAKNVNPAAFWMNKQN